MTDSISEASVDHLKWCFENDIRITYADLLPGLLYDEWVVMSSSDAKEDSIGLNKFFLIQYDKYGIRYCKQFDFFGDCSKLAWFYVKDQGYTGMSAYFLWSGEWKNLDSKEWVDIEKEGWNVDALVKRLTDDKGMPDEGLRK